MSERSKEVDCKSIATGYVGSNPTRSTNHLSVEELQNLIEGTLRVLKDHGIKYDIEVISSSMRQMTFIKTITLHLPTSDAEWEYVGRANWS